MRPLCTLLLAALPMLAAGPFTGTWKIDVSKAMFSDKPDTIELGNGIYKCPTCDPPITVKADGVDHPVSGSPAYDTMSVRIIDDHTVKVFAKKDGKVGYQQKTVVAPDGMTETVSFTSFPPAGAQPVTGTVSLRRVSKAEPGMHAVSGSWVAEKAENISDNGLTATFDETADGLKMTQPTGEHYDAKFDGKEYTYEGSAELNQVVLKRIDAHTIEETDKRDGEFRGKAKMTVSPDGRTMKMVVEDRQGRISTFIWNKQ